MEELVRQRIKEVIFSEKNITLTSLGGNDAAKMQLSRQINGNTSISLGTILLIIQKIPNVSAEWLLRGTGEMYLTEDKGKPSGKPQEQIGKPQEPKTYTGDTSDKDELIDSLKARIAEQENYIADLRFMARLDKKQ